jgi:hypothetical protein
MERQRRRGRRRGSITVEYVIILAVVVVPFGFLCLTLGKDMASYAATMEYLNRLPLP